MIEACDVVIIGAGQAGLSLSHELSQRGTEHIVLERGRIGQAWRDRWDSFCLVLPNWTVRLAGQSYDGDDPDGFMVRDAVVEHLGRYAASFCSPVREGVAVHSLRHDGDDRFLIRSTAGELSAREVVVASGGYQKAHRPAGTRELIASLPVIDSLRYRNPDRLPPGRILVVGSGSTGCQIAEELQLTGRDVVLACGRASWLPRRIGGRDVMSWLVTMPFINATLADLPTPAARLDASPQATGIGGGHDLHYRSLAASGVTLVGHLRTVEHGQVRFADDLAESVEFADTRYRDLCQLVRSTAAQNGWPVPELPTVPPFRARPPTSIPVADLGAVIVTTGFRPDYTSWMQFPDAFDPIGFPIQQAGSSTVVPGLHFMGLHFQRTRMSATLFGVGDDAQVLAERMQVQRLKI